MAGSVDDRFSAAGFKGKQVTVPGITLQSILDLTKWKRLALCIDIEGAEYEIIENELDVIAERCDWLLVEWHYPDDENDPEFRRALDCKKKLKKRMLFDGKKTVLHE